MNLDPVPFKVVSSGAGGDAPQGAYPIRLYGESNASDPSRIESPSGNSVAEVEDRGLFRVEVSTVNGKGIFRVEDIGGVLSALLTNEDGNPLSTDWSPSGVVVHQDLDIRIPKPPLTGNYVLKSQNGIVTWVSDAA